MGGLEADIERTSTEGTSKPSTDFGTLITRRARGVIESYLETRDRVDWGRSIKSMTEHTAHEYGGRFLLELLQNAYDAHPHNCRNGRIAIRFDETEGEHGVLYVANAGHGFTESNFRAICNLGLSDKPVGEGIGNKGVGFKSVLQICEAPEVYSSDPTDISRAGFSFRFARPEDIRELVGGDDHKSEQVLADISLYTVPVPLELANEHVSDLRAQGFATVVRMPLRSSTALEEVRKRLRELAGSSVPVLLFLRRIDLLSIEHVELDGSTVRELRREATTLNCDGAEAQRVSLTEGGEFFVFSREVDPAELHDAIRRGVAAELLDPRWLGWEAPASISVAVPVSHEIAEFRTYTYLPMGPKAPAPFAGHLNAPFFTNLARVDLDLTHPLNSMLLAGCADLAFTGAQMLASGLAPGWERAVVDLLSWKADAVHHLSAVKSLAGKELGDLDLFPTGQPANPRTSMAEGWLWPLPDADVLTVDLACETACLSPIWQSLGEDRLGRLRATMSALGHELDPSLETLAAWVETMAARCLHDDLPLSEWDLLYDDIACMFGNDAEVLTGRRVLLSDDGELRPCSGPRTSKDLQRSATPFFPPVRQRIDDEEEVDTEAELGLPSDVKKRLFYLHSGLTWYDENREQTRARAFLQEHHLVRRFDARSLLEHLRSILTPSHNKRLHRESLRFVYNLSHSKTPVRANVSELGLRVPNQAGEWIPAETALFSQQWPGTRGGDLALLAAAPSDVAPELAALRHRMLAHPQDLLRGNDSVHQWVDFFRDLGVQDGLPVLTTLDKRKLLGRNIGRGDLVKAPGVPVDITSGWGPVVRLVYQVRYPETAYVAKSPIFWLAGQANVQKLPLRHREVYARLVIAGLALWDDAYFNTAWERDRNGNKDQQLVPTPLSGFLRTAEWLPVHDPGQPKNKFSKASDSWYFPIRNTDVPRFSPLISAAFRLAVNDDATILRRLKTVGVGIWTDQQHARRLIAHLGEQLAADRLDSAQLSQFQQAYLAAWSHAAALVWPPEGGLDHLVVEMNGRLRAMAIDELSNHPALAIADKSDDPFALRLIREFGQPLMQLSQGAAQVASILAKGFDSRISLLADMKFSPILDSQVFTPTQTTTGLLDEVPWLRTTFAVVLDHRWPNPTAMSDRVFQQAMDRLSHVRLARANTIAVRVADQDRVIPKRMRGTLPIPDDHHPTLAIQGYADKCDWSLLEAIPEALLQLVGHRSLATELALVIHKLRSTHVDFHNGPTVADLAEACDVEIHAVEQTLLRIDSALIPLLERIFPFVYLWVGAEAAAALSPQAGSIKSEEELVALLASIAVSLPIEPAELVAAARTASSLDGLRKELGIDLGDLNGVLSELSPQYLVIDYAERHAEEFDWFVRSRWDGISERLRWARLPSFRARQPIARWVTIRDAKSLDPDPTWNRILDQLSEIQLEQRLEQQLSALLGEAAPTRGKALPPMASTHQSNVRQAENLYTIVARLVHSWCIKTNVAPSTVWPDMSDSRPLLQLLDEAGAFDFEILDTRSMLEWFRAIGIWPPGMPLAIDAMEIGLSEQDLQRSESEEHRILQERQRARQMVNVNGSPIDVGNGYKELRERLEASIDRNPGIITAVARFAQLEELVNSSPGQRSGSRTTTSTRPVSPRASQSQLSAIGFAGELVAYKWLANRYKEQFTDDCWVSSNRAAYLTGSPGDDGCGYDFLVPSRGGAFMYEVKATTGDAGEFQLGESEVRQAQTNARNDRWRLIIVTHALTDERQLLMLHNPFNPRSRGLFVFAGEGLRIRYSPSR